eukprot:gene15760-24071_t
MVALTGLLSLAALAAVPADLITNLPGWTGATPSKQYSGYLDFGPNNRKHMHYWYVESTKLDPAAATTPVVVWMNGGPGCSSLDGWYYEHGPFKKSGDNATKLMSNPYTWANVANMLYVESPVGVGFSYSENPSEDYKQNDDKSSQDAKDALNQFFKLYPELKTHPFYITGESYGGVYVPTTAEAILWAVGNGTWAGAPLKGIAVGNGCTGSQIGVCGGQRDQYDTEYLLGQAFIPNTLKAQIRSTCTDWNSISLECRTLLTKMSNIIQNVNLYDVYGECLDSQAQEEDENTKRILRAPLGKTDFFDPRLGGPDACIDSTDASKYFTQPSIIEATHVMKINFTWATCATAGGWTYDSNRPNLPRDTYPFLIKNIKVLIYNGDWDACVPYTDNEAWTTGMGYTAAAEWHAWKFTSEVDGSSQVGGYATRYENNNFTFITVKGGRHEVPETQPIT